MLRLTCMATFCIILETYAQKLTSEDLPADVRARLIANVNRKERFERDPLGADASPPSSSHLSIPLIDAFNPFEPSEHQLAAAKDASNQLADWIYRLRTDLLKPFSLASTGLDRGPVSVVQTHPPTAANITHLGQFTDRSGITENTNSKKERFEIANSAGFGILPKSSPIAAKKSGSEGEVADEGKSTLRTSTVANNRGTERQGGNNISDITETDADNYYDASLEIGKIPEAEESDEDLVQNDRSNSDLLEHKALSSGFTGPTQKRFTQTKNVGNTTQDLLNDVKGLVATMNLSQTQTALFIEVIEKIVEEELNRRLLSENKQTLKIVEPNEKPKLAGTKLHAPNNEIGKFAESIDEYPEIQASVNSNDEQIQPYEKLTANTRLSFDERRIIDDYRNAQDELPEVTGGGGGTSKVDFGWEGKKKADYKIREQAEYDRLVSGIIDATTPKFDYLQTRGSRFTSASDSGISITVTEGIEKAPVRRTVPVISPSLNQKARNIKQLPSVVPQRTTVVYGKATSNPRTMFERQAEDFRSRLLGNNGFGDIMRALEHANIGFYERS